MLVKCITYLRCVERYIKFGLNVPKLTHWQTMGILGRQILINHLSNIICMFMMDVEFTKVLNSIQGKKFNFGELCMWLEFTRTYVVTTT